MTNTKSKNTTHKNYITKKIVNWPEYNKSLRKRGNLAILIEETVIQKGKITKPNKSGMAGRPNKYSNDLIELILTIRELLRLPLRQTSGFIEYLFGLMGITDDIPDSSTLSRRSGKINVRFSRKNQKEGVVMLIDSSDFKVFGEGEWKVRKHGADYRRTWRETHIAVDFESRGIIGLINTSAHVHDNTQLRPLLRQVRQEGYKIKAVIGDGAYDSKNNYLLARKEKFEMIAPPPKNAAEHLNTGLHHEWYDTPGWEERNAVIRHIEEYGIDGWMADVEYHRRSLVENAFYRLKTIFGDHLKSRTEENQYTEQCLKAKLINKFNELGLPKYDWIK